MMNRRVAIKQAALLAGGMAFLPSCGVDPERASIALKKLQLNIDHERLLEKLTVAIIPDTLTPGAAKLNLQHFVMVMADDCLSPEDQEIFVEGLQKLNSFTKKHFGKAFSKGSRDEQKNMLTEIQNNKELPTKNSIDPERMRKFVSISKQFTLQGYLNSEYYLTEVLPYQLVPGSFTGCAKVV